METSPLRSGDKLPTHPNHTTSLRVIRYGRVLDAEDGHELCAGLHNAEVEMLKHGQGDLSHLYRYAIVADGGGKRIFHTRDKVVIDVGCINSDNADADQD